MKHRAATCALLFPMQALKTSLYFVRKYCKESESQLNRKIYTAMYITKIRKEVQQFIIKLYNTNGANRLQRYLVR